MISQYSKPGDYVFFQFGHNDQKLPGLQAKGGYRANLQRYIKENQAKGLSYLPILDELFWEFAYYIQFFIS